MPYTVAKVKRAHIVVDKKSKQPIIEQRKEGDARKICRSLNLGGGFNGRIPDFFLNVMEDKRIS